MNSICFLSEKWICMQTTEGIYKENFQIFGNIIENYVSYPPSLDRGMSTTRDLKHYSHRENSIIRHSKSRNKYEDSRRLFYCIFICFVILSVGLYHFLGEGSENCTIIHREIKDNCEINSKF
jgi:hypothetical protein